MRVSDPERMCDVRMFGRIGDEAAKESAHLIEQCGAWSRATVAGFTLCFASGFPFAFAMIAAAICSGVLSLMFVS
jgi:hypothetical protein